MHGALEEAVRSGSPAVAHSLVGAVQDAAELAGGLPPSVRARELQVRAAGDPTWCLLVCFLGLILCGLTICMRASIPTNAEEQQRREWYGGEWRLQEA
jgi:hypothetical protein